MSLPRKGLWRPLALVIIGAILIAGSYPIWVSVAERAAKADRARQRAKTPGGERVATFFGKVATLSDDGELWRMSRFAECLEALSEPPLTAKEAQGSQACYRFTWLRTFHRPVVFRVEVKRDGSATYQVKVADGAGGYEWGKVVRNETKVIDPALAATFKAQAQKLLKLEPYEKSRGLDGASWLIEVRMDGRYHAVSRWSPSDGEFQKMGQLFIDQAPAGTDFTPAY